MHPSLTEVNKDDDNAALSRPYDETEDDIFERIDEVEA